MARYLPQIVVSVLVMIVLTGGALYASRVTERAPKVVYSASLEEVAAESEDSLTVNINTADVEELEGLPEVGPATAEAIIEYRRANGLFRTVDDLTSVHKCKTLEVRFRALLSQDETWQLEVVRA